MPVSKFNHYKNNTNRPNVQIVQTKSYNSILKTQYVDNVREIVGSRARLAQFSRIFDLKTIESHVLFL